MVAHQTVKESSDIPNEQKVKTMNDNKKTIIKPVRDAIRLALYGKKIGRIEPDEVEEESIREQRKLSEK